MRTLAAIAILVMLMSGSATAQGFQDYREFSPGFKLDEAIEKKILSRPNIEKILHVDNLRTFRNSAKEEEIPFQILTFDVTIELKEGREAVWHGRMILVNQGGSKKWDHSYFIDPQWIEDSSRLKSMNNSEILQLIERSENERKIQSQ